MTINRRAALLGGLGATVGLPALAQQDVTFFRIGTGGTIGTYFPRWGTYCECDLQPAGLPRLQRWRFLWCQRNDCHRRCD